MLNQLIFNAFFCRVHLLALVLGSLFQALNTTAQTSIFYEDFESGSLDPTFWTATPSANGLIEVSDESPHDGTYCLKMGKSIDLGGFQTQKLDLRLDLSGFDNREVELTFCIRDYYDETHAEDGIFFSKNGVQFEKVLDFKPSDWCDNAWGQFPPLDVDELARKVFGASWSGAGFVIRFQQHGSGDFFGSADGVFFDNVSVVEAPKKYFPVRPQTPFFDDFETCKLGENWTWRFADKTNTLAQISTKPSNYVFAEPGEGLNSSCGLVIGKRCDDGPATNALDLHLDLEPQSQVALAFWIRDYYDETQADDGLYFSNDGGASFKKALDFKPADWCDNAWGYFPPIDVDELAAKINLPLTNRFIIRFQQHDDGDFFGSADGFIIDDVNVYIEDHPFFEVTAGKDFFEDFETGNFRPMWDWNSADKTNTLAAVATRPSNYVWVDNGVGFNGSEYAASFGKRCDDGFATNALDLHLDLAGEERVEMTFWILDYYDESQKDDGIWFSNDGGKTFKKAFSFNPFDWCDNTWGRFPPFDIAEMAKNIGLTLTDRFVVRFQQHDDGDFFGNADGFILDDVRVYVPEREYVKPPFVDNFETGKLGPAWAQRFAEAIGPDVLPAVTRPSNVLEVRSDNGNGSEYGVVFGKRCDDGFASNALDLHLDLGTMKGVKLSFDLLNYFEDIQALDAIYFSNDGGMTFKKVYEFNFAIIPDNVWQKNWPVPAFDVDALAAQAGLVFTNRFIIRIQQHGSGDFFGNADGIVIDNVNVTGMSVSAADEPALAAISVFPNPASDGIRVALPEHLDFDSALRWQLFDTQGRLLASGSQAVSSRVFSMPLAGFPSGILLLKLESEGQFWQGRFLKM